MIVEIAIKNVQTCLLKIPHCEAGNTVILAHVCRPAEFQCKRVGSIIERQAIGKLSRPLAGFAIACTKKLYSSEYKPFGILFGRQLKLIGIFEVQFEPTLANEIGLSILFAFVDSADNIERCNRRPKPLRSRLFAE
ncbi:hypothetical protein BGX87_07340 [Burkholderia ubonensis]|nr:hypothetical protein BGX87_07340 [Burkholderia ubonensis]